MKHQYAIRTHVCSMRLADTLKVLLKSNLLTKTVIASQGENDVTEVSVAILNRDDCSNFFHCWQIRIRLSPPSIKRILMEGLITMYGTLVSV